MKGCQTILSLIFPKLINIHFVGVLRDETTASIAFMNTFAFDVPRLRNAMRSCWYFSF